MIESIIKTGKNSDYQLFFSDKLFLRNDRSEDIFIKSLINGPNMGFENIRERKHENSILRLGNRFDPSLEQFFICCQEVAGSIPGSTIFFPRIDNSHRGRICYSFTAVHCFDNGNVGKQPVAWKEYCAEHRLKELQESMDRCTGRRDILVTEILLRTPLNTINQAFLEPVLSTYFR